MKLNDCKFTIKSFIILFIVILLSGACSPYLTTKEPLFIGDDQAKLIIDKCETMATRQYDKEIRAYDGFKRYCLVMHGWTEYYALETDWGMVTDVVLIGSLVAGFASVAGPIPSVVGCVIVGGPCFLK